VRRVSTLGVVVGELGSLSLLSFAILFPYY
jgi:hypothetical protein